MNPIAMRPIRRAEVLVLGRGWHGQEMASTYPLSDYDLESIATLTRENVERWLMTHAGDFQSITDFQATVGDETLEMGDKNWLRYLDIVYPLEELP